MKSLAPAAAAALVVAAMPAMAASPAFDAFRKVCVDSHTDFAAVKAAMETGNWKPTEVQPTTMEGVAVAESVARVITAGGAKVTVFAWYGTKGKVQVAACTARVTGLKFASLDREAQAWVGFAPDSASEGKAVWRYTETDGARKAVQKTEFDAAAAAGGLDFFTVSADGDDTLLDILKIKS